MICAAVIGATGFVGSKIIKCLLNSSDIKKIVTLSRRPLSLEEQTQSRLQSIIDVNTARWNVHLSACPEIPDIFFSALGTTRRKAGGVAAQRKIDFDLNLKLAQAAKTSGIRIYVLVSSAGVSTTGLTAYQRMKAELENAIMELGFDKTVILRPGFLCGYREHGTLPEYLANKVANALGKCCGDPLKDSWAVDADVVARAATRAAFKCIEGGGPKGNVWIIKNAEILELGRR